MTSKRDSAHPEISRLRSKGFGSISPGCHIALYDGLFFCTKSGEYQA
jgi:hypothetical protein